MKLSIPSSVVVVVVAAGISSVFNEYECHAWSTKAKIFVGMRRSIFNNFNNVNNFNTQYNNNHNVHPRHHQWHQTTRRNSQTHLYNNISNNDNNSNDFNVVLRPSTDPEAFDSLKIGYGRVHRYVRDETDATGDPSAEYVMWYHGRGQNFDESKKLPPLSTGRIGRAISRNGLAWERVSEGSASEDHVGVSLGLNNESWWGFDTAHVGLGQVMLPMSTPAVMTEGGVYLMYYMGGNFEETPIVQYMSGEGGLNNIPEEATIQGMNMKIGVALSQDGISWGRVEGDDPTGAIMAPYTKNDPNMKSMASMRDDDDSLLNLPEELYCGWPDVIVTNDPSDQDNNPQSTKLKSNFHMYYSTMTKHDKVKSIALAVSDEGFRWLKRGICLKPDETGPDAAGCARATVVRKASFDEDTSIWTNAPGWIMFYEGISPEDNKHRVLMAESDDGRKWTKMGIALDVGESDQAWDNAGVGSPHIIRLDDGSSRMYYTGQGADGSTAIGVAKCEGDGSKGSLWSREQASFTFSL